MKLCYCFLLGYRAGSMSIFCIQFFIQGNGMSFVYYGVPIFALSGAEEVAALEEVCYFFFI